MSNVRRRPEIYPDLPAWLTPNITIGSKIRTNNLIEEVINKDSKQRSKVVGISPNQESCLRLMEIDEEWQTGRKYRKIIK